MKSITEKRTVRTDGLPVQLCSGVGHASWSQRRTVASIEHPTLVENLQREDLTPKEEAAALEVLMREHHWTTRQVGEAIKRSHIYVSRRLRVFEDDVLGDPVFAGQIAVSTAEELLRAEPQARPELAGRAIAENWAPADARRAVVESSSWNDSFQSGHPSPRQASRIRALHDELACLDLATCLRAQGANSRGLSSSSAPDGTHS
jgi:ParB family transcriptional regulator, chromosome partitioning protein